MMENKIKIAIVDDNKKLAESLELLLANFDNLKFKWWANNGLTALEKLTEDSDIDLILMDIQMPALNGIKTTIEIKKKYPEIKILMLTVFGDDENIFDAIIAGASGYLLKDEKPRKLVEAIEEAMGGGAPMSPQIALKALNLIRQQKPEAKNAEDFNITERELEILQQLASGKSYTEIAEKLFISPKTVRKHIENIYPKLRVHSKLEAIMLAQKHKLI